MPHRTVRGKILYTSKKPDMMDKQRGFEVFTFIHHADGRVTLQAHCEIDEPHPPVMRDVIYSMNPDGTPADAFVRLSLGERFLGAGFFRMTEGFIECESYGPSIGRISQIVETEGPYDWFGTHPISADGFNTRCFDRTEGPKRRRMRGFAPSLDHRGATPPIIDGHHMLLEYVGDETVTVTAGTFDTLHYHYLGESDDPQGHPPYDVWVTADADTIFVKGGVAGYMMTQYELVELDR